MALYLRLVVIAWNKAIKAAAFNHRAKLFVELEKRRHELRFELCPKIPFLVDYAAMSRYKIRQFGFN